MFWCSLWTTPKSSSNHLESNFVQKKNKKNVYGSLFIFFTIRIKSKLSQHFHIEDKIRLKLLCLLAMKDVSIELPQWIWTNLNPYIYLNPYILMFQFRAYCWTMISFGTNSKIHFDLTALSALAKSALTILSEVLLRSRARYGAPAVLTEKCLSALLSCCSCQHCLHLPSHLISDAHLSLTCSYTPGWNVWGECLFYEVNAPLLQVCYKP